MAETFVMFWDFFSLSHLLWIEKRNRVWKVMAQGIDLFNSINGVIAFIVTLNISKHSANKIP